MQWPGAYMIAQFQSTLSVRRATGVLPGQLSIDDISIHALREESDVIIAALPQIIQDFNPRSPWGERHLGNGLHAWGYSISIHALREESDKTVLIVEHISLNFNPRSPWGERPEHWNICISWTYFNPRSPWGERPAFVVMQILAGKFQSTLSVRRATRKSVCK